MAKIMARLNRDFTMDEVGWVHSSNLQLTDKEVAEANAIAFQKGTLGFICSDSDWLTSWTFKPMEQIKESDFYFGIEEWEFEVVQTEGSHIVLFAGQGAINLVDDGSVYIYSLMYGYEPEEILMWSSDEFAEDPSLVVTVLALVANLIKNGFEGIKHIQDYFHCSNCGEPADKILNHFAICNDCM